MNKKLQSFSNQSVVIPKKVSKLIDEVNILNEDLFKVLIKMGSVLENLKSELDASNLTTEDIEKELPFTWRHAKNLMQISKSPILTNKKIQKRLPQAVGTLTVLTKMHESRPALFKKALEEEIEVKDGKDTILRPLIHPEMIRKDIENFRENKVQGHSTKKNNSKNTVTETIEIEFRKDITYTFLSKKLKHLSNVSEHHFKVKPDAKKFSKYMKVKNTPFKKGTKK
jgi:hypothetical protein